MSKKTEKPVKMFDSEKFSPKMLEEALWDTLVRVKNKKIKPSEANAVTMAAKEICSIARLRIQVRVLAGLGSTAPQLENEEQ